MTDMPEVIYAFSTGETDHPEFWAGGCTNSSTYMEKMSLKYIRSDKHEELKAIADKMARALSELKDKVGHPANGFDRYSCASLKGECYKCNAIEALTEYNKYKERV